MANLKIIKSANGTVRFFKVSANATEAVLQPSVGFSVSHKLGDGEFIIKDLTGTNYGFKTSSVVSTQVEPAAEIPFSGTTEDLVTLLRTDFFF